MTSSEKILTILLIANKKRMTILILELYSLLSVLTALTPKTKIPIRTPDITLPPQNHNPSLILQILKPIPTWNNAFKTVFGAVYLDVERQHVNIRIRKP